ncbi:MAG: class I SAM-dependent methyltransferase, partial [Bacteroidota bacterium]
MPFDFDKIAADYDRWYEKEPGISCDRLQKSAVKKYLDMMNGKTILEIGSGTGHWTKFLSENGFFVLGIDISEKMIAVARSRQIPYATFVHCDAASLPYNNESISNIAMFATLEFIENQGIALREIYRVLSPGGTLLIGTVNPAGSLARGRKSNELFENGKYYSADSLQSILELFGDPEIEGCALLPKA